MNQPLDQDSVNRLSMTLPPWVQYVTEITTGVRRRDYGHPLTNFLRIAIRWTAWAQERVKVGEYSAGALIPMQKELVLFSSDGKIYKPSILITPLDVVVMMVDTKIAREMNTEKEDNWLDMLGYLFCAAFMHQRMKEMGFGEGVFAFYSSNFSEMNDLLEKSVLLDAIDRQKLDTEPNVALR